MFKGNWKCSTCGGAITELPFEPRGEAGLTCRACFMKKKDGENGAAAAPESAAPAGEPDTRDIPDFDDAMMTAGEQAPGDDFGGTAAPAAPKSDRPSFTGDWKCAGCGAAITSLPFEPRSTENLKCLDCFKKSKQ